MPDRIMVPFRGAGSGVDELSWGQRELWGGMRRQRTWMPMGIVVPLLDGSSVDDVVAELRFVVERYQSMRTRLRLRPDGPPQQVLSEAGEMPLEVVDAPEDGDPAVTAAEVQRRLEDTAFDFERDWPVRTAVIRHRGAPTHQVTVVCHLVADGFGAMVLVDEVDRWRRSEALDASPDGMQPLEQAQWQRSPAGQRQCAAALRHWEHTLRAIPARRFPGPVDPRRPRHWQAGFASRALHLAARVIARRTGTDRATVLLTAFAVGLTEATGIHPAVVKVVVSNRFRRTLAGSVSPVSQPALCVLDVDGLPFDEAVALTGRRALTAYKHAYYDPDQLDALIQRVGRERGEELDIACYFNDRRPQGATADPAPSTAEVRAALAETRFHWMARQDRPNERLFLTISATPDTVDLDICGDTEHLSPAMLEACVRKMEAVTVAAAGLAPAEELTG
ncbi:condensation domain-containing protein [Dactylosporangium sp. NBC_01737]|uniref:condensation domain-containing protein n=1 Tax=Dactylosporangium sp. NBC_01737 TaxID=2975959 RepID=UPI002E0D982C|nr:condensation domain-containing protein [Dactylosporangium sp. NBC_01737]